MVLPTRTGPVSPRAYVPGAIAVVCPEIEIEAPHDVTTREIAVLLNRR